jgi:hypothetical protein
VEILYSLQEVAAASSHTFKGVKKSKAIKKYQVLLNCKENYHRHTQRERENLNLYKKN